MLTKNNFKKVLEALGFTKKGNIFQKSIGEVNLIVDFEKKELIYPKDRGLTVNRRDTCNFSQNENFVVFECVHRLPDFFEDKLDYEYKLIPHLDNPQILAEDTTLMLFENANRAEERFAVWRDTYKLEFTEVGIFEKNIQPYQIGKDNYTLAEDTKPIDADDKKGKHDRFRTILRKHNIARRETAFEVLVNLFLCKLVDEEDNKTDLKFSWKGIAYDNYFDFVDRLQNLYHIGMEKFLGKNISYISNEQIDKAFWAVRNDTNATKKKIQDYFRELKFYTNSAFSLMDTHNEELFKRNAKVLLEIVQMWQGIRLKTDEQNQFLGEMFELFLDDGVKQSEGQFFTPLPICKFIVGSLPLEQKIIENAEPLKAIDFACGSGHFLNEYAHQIKPLVEEQKRDLYFSHITGIEKEDRLAKVAKVAAYMHGQEQIKILDADALASHPDEVPRESFDVLVANPPFAVKEFLHTLSKDDKQQYQLIKATGEDSDTNTIQCFFLERIHHLMAPDGVVGVIVPSSILSNANAVHIRTREILLQFFDLVSIAQLGSSTFGKTGTNTVVLLLKRKEPRPEPADHYLNRVKNFFEGDEEKIQYQDHDLIQAYCKHIEIPYEEYIKLFAQTSLEPLAELLQYEIFKDYERDFDPDKEIEKIEKSKEFRGETEAERLAELGRRFIAYLHNIEKDKLYYFILAHKQAGKVLIVKAPSTNKEQKQFLGYEWSDKKNNEGIKYNGGDTVNDIITPLFDPKDLDNEKKINTAIKRNFFGEITDELPDHCQYANLTDMLDFSRIDFKKVINLNPKQQIDIESKWEQKTIDNLLIKIDGNKTQIQEKEIVEEGETAVVTQEKDLLISGYTDKKEVITDLPLIVFGDHSCTFKYIDFPFICGADGTQLLKVDENEIIPKCFYYLVQLVEIPNRDKYERHFKYLKRLKIPLPPSEIQQQIVDECDAVDQETDQVRQAIIAAQQMIKEKVQVVINAGYEIKKIGDVYNTASGGTPLSSKKKYYENGTIPWINSGEVSKKEINFADNFITELGLNNSNAKLFPKGTVLLAMYGATAGKVALLNIKASTNQALCALLPTEEMAPKFLVLVIESMYQYLLNLRTGIARDNLSQEKIRNIRIPVPPLDIQQRLAAEVEQLEAKITQAQVVIDNTTERKNAILTKYL